MSAQPLEAYRPRPFRYLGLWRDGEWAFKAYGIHHREPSPSDPLIDPAIVDAARDFVCGLVPKAEAEGDHYGMGYVVLHQGTAGNWLLMQWWAHNDICCQILARSDAAAPDRFEIVERPLMACVWELVIIDFERRAWVETALSGSGNRGAYLDRTMPDGLH
ncbi:MAG: hypothetical protein MI806_01075 [Minwuiales bacterium]|nr:hypothetical protein [Minwuiales bacterium]